MKEAGFREKILSAAELRARAGGYNGFSFRDIAADVGIKSSSVHHHFPTKADLCAALARRYTEAARLHLGAPGELPRAEAIARVVQLFRDALIKDDQMCLCGLLGAERDALPAEVERPVAEFFQMVLDFLGTNCRPRSAGRSPAAILASLEGGLILARAMRDPSLFESAVASIGAVRNSRVPLHTRSPGKSTPS